MSANYQVLSGIYDELDMGRFGREAISRIVNYAQRNGWMGRAFLDVGCGTGASLDFLNQYSYIVSGVDQSSEMLAIAQAKHSNNTFHEQDIRHLNNISTVDMVICLNVMNELDNLNDIKSAFTSIYEVVKEDKLFVFDMYTIEGLVERYNRGDRLVYRDEEDSAMVFSTNDFDYERQVHLRRYAIFKKTDDSLWQRSEANRILRGYPIQAIVALLQRTGFRLSSLLMDNFERYVPNDSRSSRVIFVAQKQ
jgi:SAM-dependent methyltransferase